MRGRSRGIRNSRRSGQRVLSYQRPTATFDSQPKKAKIATPSRQAARIAANSSALCRRDW